MNNGFGNEKTELFIKRNPSLDEKEQIVSAIGSFGRWQFWKCLYIVAVIWIPASFFLLNMVFYRAETDYWCSVPSYLGNFNQKEWKEVTNLLLPGSCHFRDLPYDTFENASHFLEHAKLNIQSLRDRNNLKECTSWEHDRSFWKQTIIQEWDLVCDKEGQQKWTQQATFFGLLIGVFASGLLSDRIGRWYAMMLLLTAAIISGLITAFAPSYPIFLVGTFGCGFSSIGFGTVMYCWMMELLAGKEKTIFGCLPHLNFAFWGLAMAGIAYLFPHWRHMQLIFTIPLVLLYITFWILPESPRWLLVHGRVEEAEHVIKSIAKFNDRPLPPDFHLTPHEHERGKGIWGFLELFKTPNLRKKTVIIYFMWFSTSMVYYGLTLNSNKKGSLFVYYSMGKLMEFPVIGLVIVLLLKAGRRLTLVFLFGLCGLSLISTGIVPQDLEWAHVFLNTFGRGCGTGLLCLCYVYSAEIYPTVIRNIGIGSSSFWARIGPMIAPYITELASWSPKLPVMIFGCFSLLACFLVTFLPETANHKLPDTVAEGEEMGKGDTLYSSMRRKK